jgi:hypothetical protein
MNVASTAFVRRRAPQHTRGDTGGHGMATIDLFRQAQRRSALPIAIQRTWQVTARYRQAKSVLPRSMLVERPKTAEEAVRSWPNERSCCESTWWHRCNLSHSRTRLRRVLTKSGHVVCFLVLTHEVITRSASGGMKLVALGCGLELYLDYRFGRYSVSKSNCNGLGGCAKSECYSRQVITERRCSRVCNAEYVVYRSYSDAKFSTRVGRHWDPTSGIVEDRRPTGGLRCRRNNG